MKEFSVNVSDKSKAIFILKTDCLQMQVRL